MRFDSKKFSEVLQARATGYTLRELAEATGVSASTLSRLERGTTPDVETFFTLCAWLDVSPALFMRGTSEGETCQNCAIYRQKLAQIEILAKTR